MAFPEPPFASRNCESGAATSMPVDAAASQSEHKAALAGGYDFAKSNNHTGKEQAPVPMPTITPDAMKTGRSSTMVPQKKPDAAKMAPERTRADRNGRPPFRQWLATPQNSACNAMDSEKISRGQDRSYRHGTQKNKACAKPNPINATMQPAIMAASRVSRLGEKLCSTFFTLSPNPCRIRNAAVTSCRTLCRVNPADKACSLKADKRQFRADAVGAVIPVRDA